MEKEKNEIQASVTVKLAVNGKIYHADVSDCFSVNYLKGVPYICARGGYYDAKLELVEKDKLNN